MKAYVVLSLLLVYNVGGYKAEEYFPQCQDDGISVAALVNQENEVYLSDEEVLDAEDIIAVSQPDEETIQPNETLLETERELLNRVQFYLYTKANPRKGQQLFLNNVATLQQSNFNFSKPTKIVTHGFLNSVKSDAVSLVRDAYLKHGDYNIVGINWRKIAFNPNYIYAAKRVHMVSKFSAQFLNFLEKEGLDLSTVTIVGHSLGAHVAGLTARFSEGNVEQVMALDPALPLFLLAGPGERVARGDAKYLQVIHTNANVFGYKKAIGDIDFYPNGGHSQRGCFKDPVCSHLRAYKFFAESINSDKFLAVECENYKKFKKGECNSNTQVSMGGVNPDYKVKGTFYLDTNWKSPYAKGTIKWPVV